MSRIILLLSLASCTSLLFSQQKYEQEYRLDEEEVPALAYDFVGDISFDRKVRWYLEEGLDRFSIEAKTKYRGNRYSLEFDSTGRLEDIEIEIEMEELPARVVDSMHTRLSRDFEKYKVTKVQLQLVGKPARLKEWFEIPFATNEEIEVNYEIVAKTRNGKERKEWEFLFDDGGKKLSASEIITKNTDILEF